MYGRERGVLLRHYLEQGLSKAEIARILGVSRQTLYYWINTEQLDRDLDNGPVRYTPRPPVARKIDRYRQMMQVRLAEYPRLSATRLFEEVRAAGYCGGYTQVKEFVREARPGPPEDPVVRFETPPGLQAQVDFAEFRLPWGKRFALLVVMGYSPGRFRPRAPWRGNSRTLASRVKVSMAFVRAIASKTKNSAGNHGNGATPLPWTRTKYGEA